MTRDGVVAIILRDHMSWAGFNENRPALEFMVKVWEKEDANAEQRAAVPFAKRLLEIKDEAEYKRLVTFLVERALEVFAAASTFERGPA